MKKSEIINAMMLEFLDAIDQQLNAMHKGSTDLDELIQNIGTYNSPKGKSYEIMVMALDSDLSKQFNLDSNGQEEA